MPGGMRPQREPATDRAAPLHRSSWVDSRIGLMSQLADPDADFDDPDDEPITVKREQELNGRPPQAHATRNSGLRPPIDRRKITRGWSLTPTARSPRRWVEPSSRLQWADVYFILRASASGTLGVYWREPGNLGSR